MPESEAPHAEPLPPGMAAPQFRLLSCEAADLPPGSRVAPDKWTSLEEQAGSPVVLVFYPGDFTPVCGDELAIFSEVLPEIERHGAKVFGIGVDSVWCHRAFAQDRHLRFPLLSDFQPKGEVSRRYGSYREQDGFSERALFVLDRDGKVFWSSLSPIDVNPGVDGVLDALERLDGGQRAESDTVEARGPEEEEAQP